MEILAITVRGSLIGHTVRWDRAPSWADTSHQLYTASVPFVRVPFKPSLLAWMILSWVWFVPRWPWRRGTSYSARRRFVERGMIALLTTIRRILPKKKNTQTNKKNVYTYRRIARRALRTNNTVCLNSPRRYFFFRFLFKKRKPVNMVKLD